MNTEELKQFIKTHRVIEQTIDGFWNYINNWMSSQRVGNPRKSCMLH